MAGGRPGSRTKSRKRTTRTRASTRRRARARSSTSRPPAPSGRCARPRSGSTAAPPSALVGGSGSGKTTLLRILAGAVPPTAGRAVLAGRPSPLINVAVQLMAPACRRRRTRPSPAALGRCHEAGAPPRLDEIFELAEISARERASGVTRAPYKLAVGVALGLDSDVLLLDDPFASASAAFSRPSRGDDRRRHAEGATVLLETRDRESAPQPLLRGAVARPRRRPADGPDRRDPRRARCRGAAARGQAALIREATRGFNETAAIVSGTAERGRRASRRVELRLERRRAAVTVAGGRRPRGTTASGSGSSSPIRSSASFLASTASGSPATRCRRAATRARPGARARRRGPRP